MTLLAIQGLTQRYDGVTALDGLSLTVDRGETVSLLGPSGCGKSTCLRLVAGLEVPSAGVIDIAGRRVASPGWGERPERRGVNMVFQDYALWPHMRVRTIVGYGLTRWQGWTRAERDSRVDRLLSMLRITRLADRYPGQLSGGQQQRVAIARALATEPQLLLFDEPLSNLDVQLRHEMRQELAELFSQLDTGVLYVTHDPLEACSLADRLVVMRNGAIEQEGTPRALFTAPDSLWVASLAGFDGRIGARLSAQDSEGRVVVAIGDQTLGATARGPWAENAGSGRSVTLAIDSSAMKVIDDHAGHSPDATGSNCLTGTVRSSLYEGKRWRLRVDLGLGAQLSLLADQGHGVGDHVTIAVPVAAALAFDRPQDDHATTSDARTLASPADSSRAAAE